MENPYYIPGQLQQFLVLCLIVSVPFCKGEGEDAERHQGVLCYNCMGIADCKALGQGANSVAQCHDNTLCWTNVKVINGKTTAVKKQCTSNTNKDNRPVGECVIFDPAKPDVYQCYCEGTKCNVESHGLDFVPEQAKSTTPVTTSEATTSKATTTSATTTQKPTTTTKKEDDVSKSSSTHPTTKEDDQDELAAAGKKRSSTTPKSKSSTDSKSGRKGEMLDGELKDDNDNDGDAEEVVVEVEDCDDNGMRPRGMIKGRGIGVRGDKGKSLAEVKPDHRNHPLNREEIRDVKFLPGAAHRMSLRISSIHILTYFIIARFAI